MLNASSSLVAFKLSLTGRNIEQNIVNNWVVLYDNDCGTSSCNRRNGLGWTVFE
jgi:hypothetical protein